LSYGRIMLVDVRRPQVALRFGFFAAGLLEP